MRDLRDPNQWRRAGQEFGQWWHAYGGIVVGVLPIVGSLYDLASLALERDPISGQRLTDVEQGLILGELLLGGLGFVDELFEAGSTAARLRHLDEFTAGESALLRGDDLRRALAGFDGGGALSRRLSHLDEATALRLSRLDDFTAGDRALLRGDDLRRALGGFDDGGSALSRRLDAATLRRAVVPYDVRVAARQLNIPERVTDAIVENLRPGRSVAIELNDLGGGRLAMKPAATYLDDIAPYKHINLKASKSDDFGLLLDEGGQLHISDPDIMIIIDDGRILSDAATVKLADDMNFVARGRREVGPNAVKRGPIRVEPTDPFQHSGRATFFTAEGAGEYRHISDAPPEHGVAVFTLDPRGRPIVNRVPGEAYLDWVRKAAYNEDLRYYPWANPNPGGNPNFDWTDWYEQNGRQLVVQNPIVVQNSIGAHAARQMVERGITPGMVNKAIEKGTRYYDLRTKTITYILEEGFASGKNLQVATNPFTGKVTTVMRRSRFNPNTLLPNGTPRWVPIE